MVRKRTRIEIINDILLVLIRNGGQVKPTHLMYKANLSYNQMNTYLSELIEKKMVEKLKENENKRELIGITERGYKFADELQKFNAFEDAFGI